MASYRKMPSGKWQYRVKYRGPDGSYPEISKSGFKTKTEAKAEAEKIERQLKLGAIDVDALFIDYLQNWYDTFKKPNIKEITHKRNLGMLKAAKSLFGTIKIKEMTRSMYQKAMNEYGETRVKSTVKRLHDMLKSCLDHAVYEGIIQRTPAYKIEINGKIGQSGEMKFLSKFEASSLKNALLDGYHPRMTGRAMCLFALATGCRIGEVMAICEEDVNFSFQTVSINKSFDYKINMDLKETKTKSSIRTISLDKGTLELVNTLINFNKERYIRLGKRPVRRYVFAGFDLTPISNNAANKALRKACRKAGIKEITFHGLRHTHASILIYEGVPIEYVSHRLGHHSTTMTADVYTHVIKEMKDKGDSMVRNVMNGI